MRSMRALSVAVLAPAVLIGASARPATAQVSSSGTVSGTIQDGQGAGIPGATVVLTSESQGTTLAPVVSGVSGDFVIPNLTPDTYTIEVTMPSFKTVRQTGIRVDAQSRVALKPIILEIGGVTEVVDVKAEVPLIQATTGERSFTVATESVENLPLTDRSFTSLASLAPGITGLERIGGGGDTNVMMDGVSSISPGNNAPLLLMNVESFAEIKVVTSGYQAEYGRSSGAQINAVTKSGTNRFHGSVYDLERSSDWNSNSKTNILNGDPKEISRQRDFGYTIGGPIGKPGGKNKIFFFHSQEFQPRRAGNNVVRYRVPTALERMGDFSRSTDQNGAIYNFIRDSSQSAACTASSTAGCFADGGVLGKIPQSRLYSPGLAVLNMYPLPTIDNVPAGQNYNYEVLRPEEKALGTQASVKIDYQVSPAFRVSGKLAQFRQEPQTFNGSIPGFNDSRITNPPIRSTAFTASWTVNSTTFIEGLFGTSTIQASGCNLGGGATGPSFCTTGWPMSPVANRLEAGLGNFPLLFPDASVIDPSLLMYRLINDVNPSPSVWDGTRINLMPILTWGNRVSPAPPNSNMGGNWNNNLEWDLTASLTKLIGRHTVKTGFYMSQINREVNVQRGNNTVFGALNFGQDANNPFDTTFGYANAATGTFNSFTQANKYIEAKNQGRNIEAYIQDNWKVTERLSLDYGLRFVHQEPAVDQYGQAVTFFNDLWNRTDAPHLYVAGCANGVYPCSGNNRQALNPDTGRFLGPGSALAIGTVIPGTGDPTNGLRLQGQGIVFDGFKWPALSLGPRFGAAYDITGKQQFIVRGGVGLFFDRPGANFVNGQGANPPISNLVTVRYGQLQNLGSSGLSAAPAASLTGLYEYEPGSLPASLQWNVGNQVTLPFSMVADVSYVGQHAWAQPVTREINGIGLGTAYEPKYQDPTLTSLPSGASAVSSDLMRPLTGYGAVSETRQDGWETYHSMQFSLNRRFTRGLALGFADTWSFYHHRSTNPRYDHLPDGTAVVRGDQREADRLLGTAVDQTHIMRATFVWDLPDLPASTGARRAMALILNDWRLSGVWSGATGGAYSIDYAYSNNGTPLILTGSPDFPARTIIVGDPGNGCSGDRFSQFNTAAFVGPTPGSVGLESGAGYLRGCFLSTLDVAVTRMFRLGGSRSFQVRVEMFNAPNSAIITGRQATMNLANPSSNTVITNLPYDQNGNLIDARSRPRGAGFGVANAYQSPRAVQLQLRFAF